MNNSKQTVEELAHEALLQAKALLSIENYPEKFQATFREALTTKILNFGFSSTTFVDSTVRDDTTPTDFMVHVLPFLEANPKIKSLDISALNLCSGGTAAFTAFVDAYTGEGDLLPRDPKSIELLIALANIKTLTSLNISNNHIQEEEAIAFAKALANNTNLTTLKISGNEIENKGAIALFSANSKITTLDLTINQFDYNDPEFINALSKNTTLTTLYTDTPLERALEELRLKRIEEEKAFYRCTVKNNPAMLVLKGQRDVLKKILKYNEVESQIESFKKPEF